MCFRVGGAVICSEVILRRVEEMCEAGFCGSIHKLNVRLGLSVRTLMPQINTEISKETHVVKREAHSKEVSIFSFFTLHKENCII